MKFLFAHPGAPSGKALDLGLLLMRLVFGGTMALAHGLGKFQNFAEMSERFGDPIGVGPMPSLILAIFGELVCSILIVLGLFFRAALIPAMITMAVAFFVVHGADPWQKKEMAFLYLSAFAIMFVMGPGNIVIKKK